MLLQVGLSEAAPSDMLELCYNWHDYPLMLLQMEKFEKSLESVQRSFSTIRTGRATPTMLDRVQVCVNSLLLEACSAAQSRCKGASSRIFCAHSFVMSEAGTPSMLDCMQKLCRWYLAGLVAIRQS